MNVIRDHDAYRSVLLTGNNPQKLIDGLEIDFSENDEADYQKALEVLLNRWIESDGGHSERRSDLNGFMAVFERGEGGTPHVHILLCSKNPIRVSTIKKRFPGFHIDPLRGSIDDASDYIFKRGRHQGKAFSTLCEPLVWGDIWSSTGSLKHGDREKVYELADRLIREGMTPNKMMLAEPKLAGFEKMVNALYTAHIQSSVPPFRDVSVYWHLGPSGSGKTHTYIELCEQYGEDDVYLVSCTTKHPWDGYSETNKKVVIDELRPGFFSAGELLTLLDGYKTLLGARYRDKFANWDELHITSIAPPEAVFDCRGRCEGGFDTIDQLMRRIDRIIYHYTDDSLEGVGRYRRLEISPDEYRGLADLESRARCLLSA